MHRFPHLRALFEDGDGASRRPAVPCRRRPDPDLWRCPRLVANTAAALREEYGIGRGDRVAIAAANRYEHVIMIWAVIVLGGVVVGLNGWWTGAELEYGIRLTDPKLLIGDDRASRAPRRSGPDLPRCDLDDAGAAWFDGDEHSRRPSIDEDDPFVILFTSGTTGKPKGAVLTHRNNIHWAQSIALRSAAAAATPTESCELAALPLFHVSGLTAQAIPAVTTGDQARVPAATGRWSPEQQLRLTEEHGVTAWRLVPTQAWRLLECPDLDRYDVSSLRSIVGGGSVWSPQLLERLATQWPHARAGLINGFGMTETCGTGASAVMPGVLDHPGSVGGPPPLADLRVCDPGTDVQLGTAKRARSRSGARRCSSATTATRTRPARW